MRSKNESKLKKGNYMEPSNSEIFSTYLAVFSALAFRRFGSVTNNAGNPLVHNGKRKIGVIYRTPRDL